MTASTVEAQYSFASLQAKADSTAMKGRQTWVEEQRGQEVGEQRERENMISGRGDTLLPTCDVLSKRLLGAQRALSEDLAFFEGSTKCYCYIVTALAHVANLFHPNLLFTVETKV